MYQRRLDTRHKSFFITWWRLPCCTFCTWKHQRYCELNVRTCKTSKRYIAQLSWLLHNQDKESQEGFCIKLGGARNLAALSHDIMMLYDTCPTSSAEYLNLNFRCHLFGLTGGACKSTITSHCRAALLHSGMTTVSHCYVEQRCFTQVWPQWATAM